MEDQRVTLRRVTPTDVDDVAAIFRTSRRHFLPYLPDLHSFEEDKDYFSNVVFKENEVWVAEENDVLVGFCAFRKEWLDHLYFLPARVSKNLGATLLDRAKQEQPLLQLWVFQQNTRPQAFTSVMGSARCGKRMGPPARKSCRMRSTNGAGKPSDWGQGKSA
ncbi:putative acetyltransferase [compost metagenome]|jgi:hypothetical protein|uniref:GNAT family N-acetyltransferase n=1 Tax=Agrobacterium radiobacter TaxID=362 RepID=A0ABD5LD01_AGRRD|nr:MULTISPECIES: GNAT family N-acetyltransferase [Agrobacterium tumefaciens complex]MCP2133300.1 hypothetical protein [Rhizobium sp. SLBN-94]MBB4281984.1 hypothetical protein [Agrobacterium radiobacter]MBB4318608.1 hypothetical protein [Agrobacterium radiobacter]MBB4323877.1 hypothetical protein [Agrobacterium radiobacter]MBB4333372.1 hypothetical protein [Agrobacterium radiobacter]